jgi:class 3 adenylate cyclase
MGSGKSQHLGFLRFGPHQEGPHHVEAVKDTALEGGRNARLELVDANAEVIGRACARSRITRGRAAVVPSDCRPAWHGFFCAPAQTPKEKYLVNIKLFDTLENLGERTRDKFDHKPKVIVKDDDFDVAKLPIGDTWHRLTDTVAVVFDLLHSTNLEKGRSPASTASIYDAGVGGVVSLFDTFDADFVDIQGDGGFALFWGERRYERAMCAAISIRSFSDDFTAKIDAKWPDAPTTGFKIGVASGAVLAKRVGLERHLDLQEPVWAGRPVNFASKAAQQQTDADHIFITASVWDAIENNDYLTFSCGCPASSEPSALWDSIELEKIPGPEKFGQALMNRWCAVHGENFCNAILDGQKRRDGISDAARSKHLVLSNGTRERMDAFKVRTEIRKQIQADLRKSREVQLAEFTASLKANIGA